MDYGKFYFNSPKGYSRKIINAQTELDKQDFFVSTEKKI